MQFLFHNVVVPRELMWTLRGVVILLLIVAAILYRRTRRQTQQLELAYRTAIEASQAKTEFLAVMSHELRTPLTAVMGYTELLLDGLGGELEDGAKDMLGRIDESSRHLLSLIEQVLDISSAEKGGMKVCYDRADLRDIFVRTSAILKPLARKKELAFYVNAPAIPVLGESDLAKFRQIIINLVSNAVKFTDHGSVTLELVVLPATLVIQVRDTGRGMTVDEQQRVFDPFWRSETGSTRKTEGAGLGLAVTREIVKLLQGSITVQSTPGSGTLFEVRLPRYRNALPHPSLELVAAA